MHESHLETRVSHLKVSHLKIIPWRDLVRAALYTCKMYKVIAVFSALCTAIYRYPLYNVYNIVYNTPLESMHG